jgi:hypothetical protein
MSVVSSRSSWSLLFLSLGLWSCQGARSFERRWVYAPPDRASARNIASLTCPGPAGNRVLPQLGDISFTSKGADLLEGKTDQGCTWQFRAQGKTAELSPEGQSCHNVTFDTDYSIDRWVLTQDAEGATAKETLMATSHQPGMDCVFELRDGLRTTAPDDDSADTTAGYMGKWVHTPPSELTGANVAMLTCPPAQMPAFQPVSGSYLFSRKSLHTVEALGDDGCTWTLEIHAGAAKLMPASQTCTHPDLSRETRTYWAISSDGALQTEILRAERASAQQTCVMVIAAGERTRVDQ